VTDEEINRRVAVALGWRWVKLTFVSSFESRVTVRFMPPTLKVSVTTGVDYLGAEPEKHDEDFKILPDYCRDPAAADLVKHHLKSRGCHYRTAWGTDGASAWVDTREPDYHIGESYKQECEEKALCLAFLAACEAARLNTLRQVQAEALTLQKRADSIIREMIAEDAA
jgi:hypothetical protein